MQKKTILFVLRDLVGARIAVLLIRKFVAAEHTVKIIAEGQAVKVMREAGLPTRVAGNDSLTPYDNPDEAIAQVNPHIVVVGCSFPINWELQFAQAAQNRGIPVAAIADIWGGLTRLQGLVPDLALVIDAGEVNAVMETRKARKAVILGDIAIQTDVTMTEEKRQWLGQVCDGKPTILIVGDSRANVDELVTWTVQAINRDPNPENYRIFGSFVHPKEKEQEAGLLTRIEAMFTGLQLIKHEGITTDALAAYCDITVTCFSTPGRIALHHGKRLVSIVGPESLALLQEETGMNEVELVRRRVAPALDEIEPLSHWLTSDYKHRGELWAQTSRFNINVGGDAILRAAKK